MGTLGERTCHAGDPDVGDKEPGVFEAVEVPPLHPETSHPSCGVRGWWPLSCSRCRDTLNKNTDEENKIGFSSGNK